MERNQSRYSRRNPWSAAKTTMVLLGVALAGSAGTLLFDSLVPSDVTWSDQAFLPSAAIQTVKANVGDSASVATAEASDYLPDRIAISLSAKSEDLNPTN